MSKCVIAIRHIISVVVLFWFWFCLCFGSDTISAIVTLCHDKMTIRFESWLTDQFETIIVCYVVETTKEEKHTIIIMYLDNFTAGMKMNYCDVQWSRMLVSLCRGVSVFNQMKKYQPTNFNEIIYIQSAPKRSQ